MKFAPLILVFFLFLFSCQNKTSDFSEPEHHWDSGLDSLLRDTFSINKNIDSLKKAVLSTSEDTLLIDRLNILCDFFNDADPDRMPVIIRNALRLSSDIKYKSGHSDALVNLAFFYYKQSYFLRSDSILDIAVAEARESGKNAAIINALAFKADNNRMLGEAAEGLRIATEALGYLTDKTSVLIKSKCYLSMAVCHIHLRQIEKARDYCKKVIELPPDPIAAGYLIFANELLSDIYRDQDKVLALSFFNKALELAIQNNEAVRMTELLNNVAALNPGTKTLDRMLEKVMAYEKKLKGTFRINLCLVISGVCRVQGLKILAEKYAQLSLDLSLKQNQKINIADSYFAIGEIYNDGYQGKKAAAFFIKASKAYKALDIKNRYGKSLGMAGMLLAYSKPDSATAYCLEAAEVHGENGSLSEQGWCIKNAGLACMKLNKVLEGREYLKEAIRIAEKVPDNNTLTQAYLELAYSYIEKELKIPEAEKYAKLAYLTSQGTHVANLHAATELFYEIYSKKKDFKNANEWLKIFYRLKDSTANIAQFEAQARKQNEIIEAQLEADHAAKEAVIQAEKKVKETELKEQRFMKNIFIFGLILVVGVVFFVYRSLLLNKKQNRIISLQKEQVEVQKHMIEHKQKEILDSIHYARRIQTALITNERYIEKSIEKWKSRNF